jgi:glycyl-tRNA synthetase beta chain
MTGADEKLVTRAAGLSKNDLLTTMVKEFPELQGRMGYYYARHDGEPETVAKAIEEQYFPRQAGDEIAGTPAGRCLALADRLDTLAGVFALGKRPTGNKDPFGLRRAALGLVRTLIEGNVDLSLPEFLARAIALQSCAVAAPAAVARELYDFVIERLRAYYLDGLAPGFAAGEATTEMFEAVRAREPASALDFHQRLLAVKAFLGLGEAHSLSVANKRIANILKGAGHDSAAPVDRLLFETDAERRLDAAVMAIVPAHQAGLNARHYGEILRRLATLRDPVDEFFAGVMVMAPDAAQRRNRLAQLSQLRNLFLDVADLSCLPAA